MLKDEENKIFKFLFIFLFSNNVKSLKKKLKLGL